MKRDILLICMFVFGAHAGQVNFAGKSVDQIFSALDQALIKVFEGRTLSEQGLDPVGKKDFENTANAALAATTNVATSAAVRQGLGQLPDQFQQLTLMIDFLKGQPASAKKNLIPDIKRLYAQAAHLENVGLSASLQAISPELYKKWDADVETIKSTHTVEKSTKEKLLFRSAKLKAEHILTPEQQSFFNLYKKMAPSRDLNSAEMEGLLRQSGVVKAQKSKLVNQYAIENLTDAVGKYAYYLTSGKADASQREKEATFAYDVHKQLHNLYGISKDESQLLHKASAPPAILYKLSSIYKAVWEKLLRELGSA